MKKIQLLVLNIFFFCSLFATGDSINFNAINHWETVVYASDTWHYQSGETAPPADWKTLGIDLSNWSTGRGGIGYGDGDDETTISPTQSLFIRRNFEVTDVSKIEGAFLHADYDDGFVAYLNGIEIARSNVAGTPPTHNTWATDLREAMVYQNGQHERHIVGVLDIRDLLNDGDNVLAIQIHNYEGAVSSDMSSIFYLSAAINDDSRDYRSTPPWFSAPQAFESNLPIVKIYSQNEIPDEPKIPARLEIINNGDGQINKSTDPPNEYSGDIRIELRGQSSQFFFPKKNYGFETLDSLGMDLDTSFLGFPAEEDWVLHGPYSDKTLMRNVLAMHLAQKMGQYASRTRFIDLSVNDEYWGTYVLMEKIKRDKNRVDIANLKEEDIEGEELTGGYVFKIDKGDPHWDSNYSPVNNANEKIRFQYVSPNIDKIQPEQAAYLQSYVDSFERAIVDRQFAAQVKHFSEFIDYPSFAENILHSELTKNVDAYRISSYFHKKKITNGGRIHAGPVWDFNLSFGNADYCGTADPTGWMYYEHCGNSNPIWYHTLITDPEFSRVLQCRWKELREGPFHKDSIFQFIDNQTVALGDAVDRNFERWPTLDIYVWPNAAVTGSYDGEIEFMKNYIDLRLQWMDANLWGECTPSSASTHSAKAAIKIYPNPTAGLLNISPPFGEKAHLTKVSDLSGRLIFEQLGDHDLISISHLPKGIYFLEVQLKNGERFLGRVVKE